MSCDVVGETIIDSIDFVSDVGDVLGDFGKLLGVLFVFRCVDVAGLAGLIDNPEESQAAYEPRGDDRFEVHWFTRISTGARCR